MDAGMTEGITPHHEWAVDNDTKMFDIYLEQ